MTAARRVAALAGVTLLAVTVSAPPVTAHAVAPPSVPPGPPPSGPVAPLFPTELKSLCGIATGTLPATDHTKPSSGEAMLAYRSAWRFSTGAGQKVAVIDTGVNRHPRLPRLEPGGDYVSNTDGLVDCDAHGTLVAGIIAAAPSADDGFSGVAPDATILSIRQNSGIYGPVGGGGDQSKDPSATASGVGNTLTLAFAIVRAVDLGATVINLSEVACAPVGSGLDDAALGQAVRYAFERNVVVVAAAGNVSDQTICGTQNTVTDPNQPIEAGWDTVSTIASPAWFSDYVLTVGAVTPTAAPADFSLRGPWVAVAAPGEGITSVDANGPGLVNAVLGQQGLNPVNGTSFAAPFVSGVVALIRSRYPQMTAAEVMDLVKSTARTPGAGPNPATGYGVVDPVAALTEIVAPTTTVATNARIAAPPQRDSPWSRAEVVVYTVTGAGLVGIVVAVAVATARRRDERSTGGEDHAAA